MEDKQSSRARRGRRRRVTVLAVLAIVALGALYIVLTSERAAPIPGAEPASVPAQNAPSEPAGYLYDTEVLYVSERREAYRDGDMILSIPRIGFEGPVLGSVDEQTLAQGVGLYEYAKLPSWGNPNTSIAGHRDACGQEFYDLDVLEEGDLLQLRWAGNRYTYRCRGAALVHERDWSVILCADVPLLTLTTCEIGASEQRLIVTGELILIEEDPLP